MRVFDYTDIPTVLDFSRDRSFIRLILGPFGSAKSSGMVSECCLTGLQQRPGSDGIKRIRVAVIRNTFPELEDTTMKTVFDWLPHPVCGTFNKTEHNYFVDRAFPGVGIEFMFRALDRPEHVAKLLSAEYTMAWFNEFREIPLDIFEAMQGRVGRFPSVKEGGCSWAGIIADSNPPDEGSGWYKLMEEKRPDNMRIFRQPSGLSAKAENLIWLGIYPPELLEKYGGIENIPLEVRRRIGRTYYENLSKGKDDNFVKVYIHGEYGFTTNGMPVFNNYMDQIHCSKTELEPVKGLPLILSFDMGRTPACIIGQQVKSTLYAIDELYAEDMSFPLFLQQVLKPHLLAKYWKYEFILTGDPAGKSKSEREDLTCYDHLVLAKFDPDNIIPAVTNDYVTRLGTVELMLQRRDGIIISPKCRILRRGFLGGYRKKRIQIAGEEKYRDIPEKNKFSHIADSFQYMCMLTENFNIKDIMKPKITQQPVPAAAWT